MSMEPTKPTEARPPRWTERPTRLLREAKEFRQEGRFDNALVKADQSVEVAIKAFAEAEPQLSGPTRLPDRKRVGALGRYFDEKLRCLRWVLEHEDRAQPKLLDRLVWAHDLRNTAYHASTDTMIALRDIDLAVDAAAAVHNELFRIDVTHPDLVGDPISPAPAPSPDETDLVGRDLATLLWRIAHEVDEERAGLRPSDFLDELRARSLKVGGREPRSVVGSALRLSYDRFRRAGRSVWVWREIGLRSATDLVRTWDSVERASRGDTALLERRLWSIADESVRFDDIDGITEIAVDGAVVGRLVASGPAWWFVSDLDMHQLPHLLGVQVREAWQPSMGRGRGCASVRLSVNDSVDAAVVMAATKRILGKSRPRASSFNRLVTNLPDQTDLLSPGWGPGGQPPAAEPEMGWHAYWSQYFATDVPPGFPLRPKTRMSRAWLVSRRRGILSSLRADPYGIIASVFVEDAYATEPWVLRTLNDIDGIQGRFGAPLVWQVWGQAGLYVATRATEGPITNDSAGVATSAGALVRLVRALDPWLEEVRERN